MAHPIIIFLALFIFPFEILVPTSAIAQNKDELPRFSSLKNKANIRQGPGKKYKILWSYTQGELPLEITQTYEQWRHVRDWEGANGWVHQSLLTTRRTALITPWTEEQTSLYYRIDSQDDIVAKLESQVIVFVETCNGKKCRIQVQSNVGWVEQSRLWGVYPNEKF